MNRRKGYDDRQADMDIVSALNARSDDELRSDLHSNRSYAGKGSPLSGSAFLKKNDEDRYKAETLSEPYDFEEKNALFEHSMTKGLFNDIKNSPLRDKMPHRMQIY